MNDATTVTEKTPPARRILRLRAKLRVRTRARLLARQIALALRPVPPGPKITVQDVSSGTAVDSYWNRHTVHHQHGRFISAKESAEYLRRRISEYPMFAELMNLYDDHTGQTILDYGCGPGDDVTGFLLYSNPDKVIGMDVSERALGYLSHRLALHHVDTRRVELVRINDAVAKVPVPDASIDWVQCCGVLHHTSHPQAILNEFARVMKPGARGRLMLYNRDSVMYHVWIAYAQLIVNNAFPGMTVDQAFTKSTDGPDCPVSDAWSPQRALEAVDAAGLRGTFRGGYTNVTELEWLNDYLDGARTDPRLGAEHRKFAQELIIDGHGMPVWHGKYAGIGGVYTIEKPADT